MVTVISFAVAEVGSSQADIDLAGYLEDKIAQLVSFHIITPAGGVTVLSLEADGRMAPLLGASTVAATSIRLVDWQTVNPGSDVATLNQVELTVLYLKDAPGKYP